MGLIGEGVRLIFNVAAFGIIMYLLMGAVVTGAATSIFGFGSNMFWITLAAFTVLFILKRGGR